jgi:hypothetical protein
MTFSVPAIINRIAANIARPTPLTSIAAPSVCVLANPGNDRWGGGVSHRGGGVATIGINLALRVR